MYFGVWIAYFAMLTVSISFMASRHIAKDLEGVVYDGFLLIAVSIAWAFGSWLFIREREMKGN
jgi:hypothetical protein